MIAAGEVTWKPVPKVRAFPCFRIQEIKKVAHFGLNFNLGLEMILYAYASCFFKEGGLQYVDGWAWGSLF